MPAALPIPASGSTLSKAFCAASTASMLPSAQPRICSSTDSFVTPIPVNSTSLFLDGQEIQLLALKNGESAHATAVWIPGSRADLAYNKVSVVAGGSPPRLVGNTGSSGETQAGTSLSRARSGGRARGDSCRPCIHTRIHGRHCGPGHQGTGDGYTKSGLIRIIRYQ